VLAKDKQVSIINILRTLQAYDLLYYYQHPVIIQDGEYEMVTWPNHNRGAAHNADTAFATLSQYRFILDEGSYLAILIDGSLVKANYVFKSRELIKHSLWYWPCPFKIPPEDIMIETPIDAFELYSSSWQEAVRFRTPLRFDYDPSAANDNHPASHLHMQIPGCRIPVERPIGFSTFMRFIFRHFHPDCWQGTNIWNDLSDELENDYQPCLADSDLYLPHISWHRSS